MPASGLAGRILLVAGAVAVARAFQFVSPRADDGGLSSDEAKVLKRMQYWREADNPPLPPTERYVLFTPDDGGPNNIRLGWEMTGVVALYTGRTLVLPPAKPMYLLDWGPRSERFLGQGYGPRNWQDAGHLGTKTLVEDLLNLKQLKARLPTLTWEEFQAKTGLPSFEAAVREANKQHSPCNLQGYSEVKERILYMSGGSDSVIKREGFSCSAWYERGAPVEQMKHEMGTAGWALLQHGFVWHEESFRIAAKVVSYLSIFGYNAAHMRYGDFQFTQVDAKSVASSWRDILSQSPTRTLYLATDEPPKAKAMLNLDDNVQVITWDDLFDEKKTGALLKPVKEQYSEERWFKLTGIVEELICTFSRVFVGSASSTFSGHIIRMRIQAGAPVPMSLFTKEVPGSKGEMIPQMIQTWEESGKAERFETPSDEGQEFVKVNRTMVKK